MVSLGALWQWRGRGVPRFLVEEGGIEVLFPGVIDAVVCFFDLESEDGGEFPGWVEGEGFVTLRGADKEVIEEVPVIFAWRGGHRVRHCFLLVCGFRTAGTNLPFTTDTRCDFWCCPLSTSAATPIREYTVILCIPLCRCSFRSSPS